MLFTFVYWNHHSPTCLQSTVHFSDFRPFPIYPSFSLHLPHSLSSAHPFFSSPTTSFPLYSSLSWSLYIHPPSSVSFPSTAPSFLIPISLSFPLLSQSQLCRLVSWCDRVIPTFSSPRGQRCHTTTTETETRQAMGLKSTWPEVCWLGFVEKCSWTNSPLFSHYHVSLQ